MNPKRVIGIIFTILVLLLLAAGARTAQLPGVVAEAPHVPAALPAAQPAAQPPVAEEAAPVALAPMAPPVETISGATLTQAFTLQAGWNAIYLGVEPVNESPLGADGAPTSSVIEWVFKDLAASGALESVWTYNQPPTHRDYIVDPGEGLWDAPGWERWLPQENVGPDGASRGFLSTLYTLHANTGYLVKLKEGASGSFTVSGRPMPGHHRWQAGGYNLAGFPLNSASPPTVATFAAGSPLVELRALTADGKWTLPLAGNSALAAGTAYLVRYSDDPALPEDYTAPLDLGSPAGGLPETGLAFRAGLLGNRARLQVRNLTEQAVSVVLRLPEGAQAAVALHYISDEEEPTPYDLRVAPVTLPLDAGGGAQLDFQVPAEQQPAAGATLLEVSCAGLGTRWLVPVTAAAGSRAGLWVGDVVVNDVSEARLGATDTAAGDLTVAVDPVGTSGVRGSAQLHKTGASTLAMTLTLALPALTGESYTREAPAAPYVHGWVFVDANQNGQRDADEVGLAGAPVTLAPGGTQATAVDGSYRFDAAAVGSHTLNVTTPVGYTDRFTVTIPAEVVTGTATVAPNALPNSVTLDAVGATVVTPEAYLAQLLPEPAPQAAYLPYYNASGQRVEPALNFSYVRADEVGIYAGRCTEAGGQLVYDLGTAANGVLVTSVETTLETLLADAMHIGVRRNGVDVACGDIAVGAPTAFAGGRGSEAKFRILLRVDAENNVQLLPYYVITGTQRVSAANFLSLRTLDTLPIAGADFGLVNTELEFDLGQPGNDPLNPFKHKYHPDHDNLDRKFNPYENPSQYEAYDVDRRITLVLRALPYDGDAQAAQTLDWGGVTWGGDYREVVEGLHKNAITASGFFVIRQVLAGDQLVPQDYDQD